MKPKEAADELTRLGQEMGDYDHSVSDNKTPCKFEVGEHVIAEEWDRTEPPGKRLGLCMVVGAHRMNSESGWMIRVESLATCEQRMLDQNWLTEA